MFDARPRNMTWRAYGNVQYGNCTFAAIARILEVNARRRGQVFDITDQDVISAYLDMTGGRDNGAMPIDALNYMRSIGIKGRKITAYARVDDRDLLERKSALQTFGSLYCAAAMPLRLDDDKDMRWELTPIGDRTPKDAPRSMGGHAFPVFGYQRNEEFAVPWTQEIVIEDAWADMYMEERWVFIDDRENDSVLRSAMETQLEAIKKS